MSIQTLYAEYKDYNSLASSIDKANLIELAQHLRIAPIQLDAWLSDMKIKIVVVDEDHLSIQCHNSKNEICFKITDLYATNSQLIQELIPEDEGDAYLFPKREIIELSNVVINISTNTGDLYNEAIFIVLNELLFTHFQMYIMHEDQLSKLGLAQKIWINRSIIERKKLSSGIYISFLNPALL